VKTAQGWRFKKRATKGDVAPPPKPIQPKRKLWKMDLQLGANLQYNQKDTELYTGDFKADYGDPKTRFRNTFDYHMRYGRIDGVISANNMNGLIRTEFDIAKKYFLFNAAGAGYDDIRKIDFTYEDSFGIGYTLIKMTNFVLSVDAGANYQKQFFSNGTTTEIFSPRLAASTSSCASYSFAARTGSISPRIRRMDESGTDAGRNSASLAIRKLLSSFSGGTQRSSPKVKRNFCHGESRLANSA
jgi:hypothetical protein